jgi:hypothetical protein
MWCQIVTLRPQSDFPGHSPSAHGLPAPTRPHPFAATDAQGPGAVFNVDGECIASCVAYPVTKELQARFDSRQELVELYGTPTILRNALIKEALTWCSNRQSPDAGLHAKPCGTSGTTTTGAHSIINGIDHRACVEVSVPWAPRKLVQHSAARSVACGRWLAGVPASWRMEGVDGKGVFCLQLSLLPSLCCRPAGLWRRVTSCQPGPKICHQLCSLAAGCSTCATVRQHARLTCTAQCQASCWTGWQSGQFTRSTTASPQASQSSSMTARSGQPRG